MRKKEVVEKRKEREKEKREREKRERKRKWSVWKKTFSWIGKKESRESGERTNIGSGLFLFILSEGCEKKNWFPLINSQQRHKFSFHFFWTAGLIFLLYKTKKKKKEYEKDSILFSSFQIKMKKKKWKEIKKLNLQLSD